MTELRNSWVHHGPNLGPNVWPGRHRANNRHRAAARQRQMNRLNQEGALGRAGSAEQTALLR